MSFCEAEPIVSVLSQLIQLSVLTFLREVVAEAAGKQPIQMDHALTIPRRCSSHYNFIGHPLNRNTLPIKISIRKESDFTTVYALVFN